LLLGLNIKCPPNKLEYKVGELFDPTEMVVEALYSGDTAEEIQADWMPKEPLKLSDKFIMICFYDKAVMLSISVKDVDVVDEEKAETEDDSSKVFKDKDNIQSSQSMSADTTPPKQTAIENLPDFYPSSFGLRFEYPPDDYAF
jgi:hypothetical protein